MTWTQVAKGVAGRGETEKSQCRQARKDSCASAAFTDTQLAAELWADRPNIQVPLYGEANFVCGSKWNLPIWLVTLLAHEASHCPLRQPADGREIWPGAEKGSR